MKILTDECIHKDLIVALRLAGFDVLTAVEAKLSGATDQAVFEFAIKTKRILVTFDRGFGDIFRFDLSKSYGVMIILISQMPWQELVDLPITFLKPSLKEDWRGKLIILGKKRVRIRKS